MSRNKNTLRRIAIVQDIMKKNYEPGNQSKCQRQVLRNILMKCYPISERTMRRYMKVDISKELAADKPKDDGQMEILFE
jgi:hypothetical protein